MRDLFRALASPVRIAVVHLLADGERFVHELVEETGVARPLVSQHLRVLRDVGLVRRVRQGREVAYALRDDRVAQIVHDTIAHVRANRTAHNEYQSSVHNQPVQP